MRVVKCPVTNKKFKTSAEVIRGKGVVIAREGEDVVEVSSEGVYRGRFQMGIFVASLVPGGLGDLPMFS